MRSNAENALSMVYTVLEIRRAGGNVVVVHGNGPQAANVAIQQEEDIGWYLRNRCSLSVQ